MKKKIEIFLLFSLKNILFDGYEDHLKKKLYEARGLSKALKYNISVQDNTVLVRIYYRISKIKL